MTHTVQTVFAAARSRTPLSPSPSPSHPSRAVERRRLRLRCATRLSSASSSLPFHSPVLLLALLLSALGGCTAQFVREDLKGVYDLVLGSASQCMRTFEVTDDDYRLTYGDVRMNDEGCDVADWMLRLQDNGDTGESFKLQAVIKADPEHFGLSYISTTTSELVKCGDSFIGEGTPLLFFKPNASLSVPTADLFDDPDTDAVDPDHPDLPHLAALHLRPRFRYLAIGEKCFYRASRTGPTSACFPAAARVALAHGPDTPLAALPHDARLRSAAGGATALLGWAHRDGGALAEFVELLTEGNRSLLLSEGHYLPVIRQSGEQRQHHHQTVDGTHGVQLVPAGAVRPGDSLLRVSGDAHTRSPVTVTATRYAMARGLYNPLTTDGSLVVDGFAVSTFTSAIAPRPAHALLAPLRAAAAALPPRARRALAATFAAAVDSARPLFDAAFV